PLRACFVGRLVPCKGTDMLLEAAAPLLREGRLHLDMIGDGPMLPDLRGLAQSLRIGDAVTFHGWVRHDDVPAIMTACDLLAFPSIREFGGGAVLEAMALGLPPLVVDYAGPGELVEPGWGFKVPLADRDTVIADLRAVLDRIAADPSVLDGLGAAARQRVERKFLWSRKAGQIRAVYDWVLGRRSEKPAPFETRT
ncbi:MAG: glycosyl transferase family 1, partial [Croceicoccus sp.]|nr:glycosyl transferase family 1 [Croceicoccus sp.]